jgi:hypothetical protein
VKVRALPQRAQQLLGEGVIHLAAVAGDDKTGTAAASRRGPGASASRPTRDGVGDELAHELAEGA